MAEDCERTLLRRELIRELFEEERSISELSERYGLSRKTIHSWKRRYEQEGLKGLEPKSRRPHRSPRTSCCGPHSPCPQKKAKRQIQKTLKRDLRTSAFIRAVALLRRSGPVPGILAARPPGALMHKSGPRSLFRQTQVLPMSWPSLSPMSWLMCNPCLGHLCYLCLGTAQEPRPTIGLAHSGRSTDANPLREASGSSGASTHQSRLHPI